MGSDKDKNHRSRGGSGVRAEHLNRWLVEASKKERREAEEEQTTAAEGTTVVPDGTGGEGMEYRTGKTPAEVSNWDRVVDLVQTEFG